MALSFSRKESKVVHVRATNEELGLRHSARGSIADLKELLEDSGAKSVSNNGVKVPPAHLLGMDIQGTRKSGKSTFIMGCPQLIVFKLPDGNVVPRRCRAHIVKINDLETFETAFDKLLGYATKHGVRGRYSCLAIDPVVTLFDWLAQRELDLYNNEQQKRHNAQNSYRSSKLAEEGKGFKGAPYEPLTSIDHIPGVGPYRQIGKTIASYLDRITVRGWGWMTCTHYTMKTQYIDGVPAGMAWLPDVAPTAASAVANIADMLMVAEKTTASGSSTYSLNFQHDNIEKLGGRIPMTGEVVLPDYEDTPADVVGWDYFLKAYRRAGKRYRAEQEKFSAAEARRMALLNGDK